MPKPTRELQEATTVRVLQKLFKNRKLVPGKEGPLPQLCPIPIFDHRWLGHCFELSLPTWIGYVYKSNICPSKYPFSLGFLISAPPGSGQIWTCVSENYPNPGETAGFIEKNDGSKERYGFIVKESTLEPWRLFSPLFGVSPSHRGVNNKKSTARGGIPKTMNRVLELQVPEALAHSPDAVHVGVDRHRRGVDLKPQPLTTPTNPPPTTGRVSFK